MKQLRFQGGLLPVEAEYLMSVDETFLWELHRVCPCLHWASCLFPAPDCTLHSLLYIQSSSAREQYISVTNGILLDTFEKEKKKRPAGQNSFSWPTETERGSELPIKCFLFALLVEIRGKTRSHLPSSITYYICCHRQETCCY